MTTDWIRWHHDYDAPSSSLARRLAVVQRDLRNALADAPCGEHGVRRLVSICAGDGRDVLPVLAEPGRGRDVRALLIELDPTLSRRARESAVDLGLSEVEVRTADAGAADTYQQVERAQVVLACGVFGNVTVDDVRRTVAALPALLAPGGIVIWTRGRPDDGPDPSLEVRACLADHGFAELAFTSPTDARFRVGMHQLVEHPAHPPTLRPGTRLFTFV
ncbi:class I SAM-dependent methyltransferase [Micromonospora sp. NPDC048909]|uniref:class I SAM-dependent methyltransferase n=1 Tax=Micromonospora sp. NPDC048909 TaxID=3155643 RepID=UPI00340DE8F2